jgi:hypothetical protein
LGGTRVVLLDQIRTWIEGKGEHGNAHMFLLTGQAGLGKSAIAHSISHEYEQIKCLGATFCFSKERGATHFFRTIARKLADLDHSYATCLCDIMTEDLENTTSMSRQLHDILLRPFKTSLPVLGPILIVIDALDECLDNDRALLIPLLIKAIQTLPSNIRFLVTSRPNEARPLYEYSWVKIHDLSMESATHRDILLFVQHQLHQVEGLEQPDLELVASSSECVFQYASVVCHEICFSYRTHEAPKEVFTRLVTGANTGLDGLYTLLLKNVYDKFGPNSVALHDFQRVMGRILVAQHKLTNSALIDYERVVGNGEIALLKNFDPVSKTIHHLAALLGGTNDSNAAVYFLHSSFRDYLLDQERSKDFWIGSQESHHLAMATASLRLMHLELCFNIAGLENSYIFNKEVPKFQDKVQAAVSRSLSYACRYWATHLELSACKMTEFTGFYLVTTLLQEQCLYWIEIMGLECQMALAEKSCRFLLQWMTVSQNDQNTLLI